MKRSKHSLSHYRLLTCDMGNLIPITWFEALPGDTIQHATNLLVRVSPLNTPVMHPVRIRLHHWFVPNRLIWDDWEDFITGGEDGTSTPSHPRKEQYTVAEGDIFDYLGLPPQAYVAPEGFSALPLRAYQLIWNEHYRDQDLVTAATIDTTSGTDTTTDVSIQKVAWEKDYFTTCRPWETKGNTVSIPLTGDAPVKVDGTGTADVGINNGSDANKKLTANLTYTQIGATAQSDPDYEMYADLASVSGVAINDLREALAIQRYQEARAAYGSRYVEYLRYLGVRPSDGRLQNPEYLGGGRQVIQFSEVLASDSTNTGDLYGHGISAMRSNRYRRFFEEHGIVMTLMSVIPKAIYTEQIPRGFLRTAKEDYFQRELQNIGEQEVNNREAQAGHTTPGGVFGYQDRYDEYRSGTQMNGVASEFRSTLNTWHYAREYSGDIALNSSWVQATPTKRVNKSTSTDCLYVMANHSIQARRMMTKRAVKKTF